MRSQALIGLLADPARLRVVGALALGADTVEGVIRRTGLSAAAVGRALRRLESGGLVGRRDGRLVLHEELFAAAARDGAAPKPLADHGETDPARAAVLRAFVVDGRLAQIPAAAAKRRIVLEYLVTVFEPGVRYEEKTVDALLRVWHADHAALRRYLVDEGLMVREAGVYWRGGGPVDVS